MASDPCLGMLGLARRAGKLAYGDELVRQLCADHKARCVLVAADAGESTAKKASFYAARANVPCITLPHGKDELGAAIGKNGCAVCAVSDIGMAAAAISKLAAQHSEYADVAAQLGDKNARIQSRRGKKKPRDREVQPKTDETPSAPAKPQRKPQARRHTTVHGERPFRKSTGDRPHRAGEGSRPAKQRSATGDRPFRKPLSGSRFNAQQKPSKNPRAKRVLK